MSLFSNYFNKDGESGQQNNKINTNELNINQDVF